MLQTLTFHGAMKNMNKLLLLCLLLTSLMGCEAKNQYGEPVTSKGELVERDLVFLDCKVKQIKGYEASINSRYGVIFDRANDALLTYPFKLFMLESSSMDNYYISKIDNLLKQPVSSYQHNTRWRYGEPKPSDINIWRTLNITKISRGFKASEGTAYELHRDTLEIHEFYGSDRDPVVRQCSLVDSWESLRTMTINFMETVRTKESEYQAKKKAENKI